MKLALFDLDKTLLSCDSDVEWHDFLIEKGAVAGTEKQANADMDTRYRSGEVGVLEYVRFYLRHYPPYDMATLLGWRATFLDKRIKPRILPAARTLLASHKKDLVAIITATNRFLAEPITAAFGVEHLIATEPEIANDRFTGDIVGAPCMREGKIEHLDRWLDRRGKALEDFPESWFYSDSINDLPLLERVTHPVAVDADARLKEIARSRGWRTLTLRSTGVR